MRFLEQEIEIWATIIGRQNVVNYSIYELNFLFVVIYSTFMYHNCVYVQRRTTKSQTTTDDGESLSGYNNVSYEFTHIMYLTHTVFS